MRSAVCARPYEAQRRHHTSARQRVSRSHSVDRHDQAHTFTFGDTSTRNAGGDSWPSRDMASVGRRSRRRYNSPDHAPAGRAASRIARVHVTDSTWSEFRRAIGDRSVAEVLGRYVELEVARSQSERISDADISQRELVDALGQAAVLTRSLQRITERLQARLSHRA